MKLELLNRVLVAAALVAVAITTSVWLTREPLTAAPAAQPPARIAPEPIPAPPPPARPIATPTILEVPIEVQIADAAPAPVNPPKAREPEQPTVKLANRNPSRNPDACISPVRWGLRRALEMPASADPSILTAEELPRGKRGLDDCARVSTKTVYQLAFDSRL